MTWPGIVKLLRRSDLAQRTQGWKALWESKDELALGRRELAELQDLVRQEEDLALMSQASAALLALRERGKRVLQDQFWAPFDSTHAHSGDRSAAVLAGSEEHFLPDALSLVTLARFLPGDRGIDFRMEPAYQSDWERFPVGRYRAICIVGRPALYPGLPLIECLPADLRFRFPNGDRKWKGQSVSQDSIAEYHHVEQWWGGQMTRMHEVHEAKHAERSSATRVDYAVAQRFPVMIGGQRIIVVLLAGATSLGTAGAVHWATRERVGKADFPGLDRYQDPITDATRIEALLEVTGSVHTPRRPWAPRVQLKKLFLNGRGNLVSDGPSVIRLVGAAGGASRVTSVYFDDDGISANGDEFAALIALCLKARQSPRGVVRMQDLMDDLAVWPEGRRIANWRELAQVKNYYVDAFQRRSLNGRLHLFQKDFLRLDSRVEIG